MIASRQPVLLVPLLLMVSACSAGEPPKPVVETQTNEQGCVRVRSTGPQDPTTLPVPIKQACVGPYLLKLPQNYFYNQMGTEFDGSFALALEYPSLEPFQPGEREQHTVDLRVRTIVINFMHIDGIDMQDAMRNLYTPMLHQQDDPAASLRGRKSGDAVHGLEPYYADMELIRTYLRKEGLKDSAAAMQDRWNKDWFLSRDNDGEVETIIKCTSRNVTGHGAVLRDGKMMRGAQSPVPECEQTFAINDHEILIRITYVRIALPDWRRMEGKVRELFLDNVGTIKTRADR